MVMDIYKLSMFVRQHVENFNHCKLYEQNGEKIAYQKGILYGIQLLAKGMNYDIRYIYSDEGFVTYFEVESFNFQPLFLKTKVDASFS